MRAAYYKRPGPAKDVLQVGEQPTPQPAAGEVRVRVLASGVNPSDVKSRAGAAMRPGFDLVIPHSDGAGVIDAVGSGVDHSRVGERVWLWNAQIGRPFGTAAEFVALPAEQAVPLPDAASTEVGACLGVPWLTAWRAVYYRPAPYPGTETVLVAGGVGAVGAYATQLAKRAGFRVAATVSSSEKAEIAHDLGADLVINYKSDDVAAAVRDFTAGQGLDRIVEVNLAANAHLYEQVLCRNGLVITYGSSDWSKPLPLNRWLVHGVELALFNVYETPWAIRHAAIRHCEDVLTDPSFKHRIAARFPLDRIVDAHEAVEGGKLIGRVLLLPGAEHDITLRDVE